MGAFSIGNPVIECGRAADFFFEREYICRLRGVGAVLLRSSFMKMPELPSFIPI